VVGHFCPATKEEKTAPIAEGDMVKIDFAVHIDGFVSTVAHTVVATDKPTEAV
jgi:methionine aminopeptidase